VVGVGDSVLEHEAIGILVTEHQATPQEAASLLRKLNRTSHPRFFCADC
jgi:hypothetical protein